LSYDYPIGVDGTAWNLVNKWLSDCTRHHERCNQSSQQDRWYPTRLLDLRSTTQSKIRLIETAQTPPDGPYISLSHRWNVACNKFATQDTLQALINGIEVSSLPKTFQDAVIVTRKLEVRYLWIDCLCIIQGDPNAQDWQREAGSMGHVYSNAICNLSALAPTAGDEGLLFPRNTELIRRVTVEVAWRDYTKGPYDLIDCEFWDFCVNDMPLNLRGWIYQERMLASRIIHFGSEQVLWECRELNACYTYPAGLPEDIQNRTQKQTLTTGGQHGRLPNTQVPSLSLLDQWNDLVEQYTKCDLTINDDKLVAISGIAKIFHSDLKCEYLAGLWCHNLVTSLLWKSRYGIAWRPDQYVAPSWSWASIDGPIKPWRELHVSEPHVSELITILHVRLFPRSADATGQLLDAVMRIRGTIHKGRLAETDLLDWRTNFRMMSIRDDSNDICGIVTYDINPASPPKNPVYWLPIIRKGPLGSEVVEGLVLEFAGLGQGVWWRTGTILKWDTEAEETEGGTEEERRKMYLEDEDGVLHLV